MGVTTQTPLTPGQPGTVICVSRGTVAAAARRDEENPEPSQRLSGVALASPERWRLRVGGREDHVGLLEFSVVFFMRCGSRSGLGSAASNKQTWYLRGYCVTWFSESARGGRAVEANAGQIPREGCATKRISRRECVSVLERGLECQKACQERKHARQFSEVVDDRTVVAMLRIDASKLGKFALGGRAV